MYSIVFLAAAVLTSPASALPYRLQQRTPLNFSSIVVFGDSFSDNGNEYRLSNETWPANPAYYKGHFSNGPVWNELLASNLSSPLHNYAYGGATTSNALVQGYSGANSTIPVPSLEDQVQQYLSAVPADAPVDSSLFAILGGANDILFDANLTAIQSAGVISGLLTQLRNAGASKFLLLNYPDLSMIPYDSFIPLPTQQQLGEYSTELGNQLSSLAESVERSAAYSTAASEAAKVSVTYVDLVPMFEIFGYYEGGWRDEGFDQFGLYGSCLVGAYVEAPHSLCDDPDKRVFWDEYHPTAKSHGIIAREVRDALMN